MLLSSLGAFVGDLVAGNGRCLSCCWERLWVLLLLVTVAVALVAGSGRQWLSSEAVVSGFCLKLSSVLSSVINQQW